MRSIIMVVLLSVFFSACKKDKYTTAPQINYKSVSPQFINNDINSVVPVITFRVTDSEGDLGITSKDTAFIFLKNLLTGKSDSLPFPDLKDISKSDFKADVLASIGSVLECKPVAGGLLHVDTLFYEIYIKDFAKNKSNTIVSGDPVFYECQ